MITLLLLTIAAVSIFLYKEFGKPKHRDLIQTTLSFVASCLFFQFVTSALDSPKQRLRVLSVHSSSTSYYSNKDYSSSSEIEDH